ncbi:MAG: hypothetical protein AAB209_12565, partial [Bacteroidota bacterium]
METNPSQLQAILEEFGPNAGLVEEMLEEYLKNPAAVSKTWQQYFAGIVKPTNGNGSQPTAQPTLPASPAGRQHSSVRSPSDTTPTPSIPQAPSLSPTDQA